MALFNNNIEPVINLVRVFYSMAPSLPSDLKGNIWLCRKTSDRWEQNLLCCTTTKRSSVHTSMPFVHMQIKHTYARPVRSTTVSHPSMLQSCYHCT